MILATVAELAEKVATPERLKMLTLLTLADIKAVNPDALTPWKAENLWRLYAATANYFDHSADSVRVDAESSLKTIESIVALQPLRRSEVLAFLDGLPQRYVLSHPSEQVIQHFRMATRLAVDPVQLQLLPHSGQYELTVVTERSQRAIPNARRHFVRLGDGHYQGSSLLESRRRGSRQLLL